MFSSEKNVELSEKAENDLNYCIHGTPPIGNDNQQKYLLLDDTASAISALHGYD